jgi:hypothetical protein
MDITGDEQRVTENLVRNSGFWLPDRAHYFNLRLREMKSV